MHAPDSAGTPLDGDLYRTAVVGIRFGDRAVRVEPRPRGTAEGFFPVPGGDTVIHAITAHNPRGRTAPADADARAQRLPLDEIRRRGLTWWPAEEGGPSGARPRLYLPFTSERSRWTVSCQERKSSADISTALPPLEVISTGSWSSLTCWINGKSLARASLAVMDTALPP